MCTMFKALRVNCCSATGRLLSVTCSQPSVPCSQPPCEEACVARRVTSVDGDDYSSQYYSKHFSIRVQCSMTCVCVCVCS